VSGLRWRTSGQWKPATKVGIGYSARIDWAGIRKDGFACCVISTAAKARPDFRRQGRPQTGVVLHSKNSAG
jgi:hypothetical protein